MARLCHHGGTGGTWVNKEKEYMMYTNDNRIVMTLDAGGTNFVFYAIQGGKEIDRRAAEAAACCRSPAWAGAGFESPCRSRNVTPLH